MSLLKMEIGYPSDCSPHKMQHFSAMKFKFMLCFNTEPVLEVSFQTIRLQIITKTQSDNFFRVFKSRCEEGSY